MLIASPFFNFKCNFFGGKRTVLEPLYWSYEPWLCLRGANLVFLPVF
ncbi:hypothetical protein HMPREF9104_01393 [Lentilactobacillus kisonensis F0435]|uniref:Uncharacterized protein n=1 Tax=Lentilactobacillus kisonensis F0435 TaxID=797516 RepID=H1LFL7_9LACO|nr:hypothetical protein HMPREF9104_01393 [Lentilactobacillus kisonensis F0435]